MSCTKLKLRIPSLNEGDCQETPTIPHKKDVSSKSSNKALNENRGPPKILTFSLICKLSANGIWNFLDSGSNFTPSERPGCKNQLGQETFP